MVIVDQRPARTSRPWLAHYDPGVRPTLTYPDARLDEILRRTASRYPDHTALAFFGRRTSYADLDRTVDRLAGGLRRLGLREGDRVALGLPNCPQLVAAFYAVWRAGCVVVPTNPRCTSVELVAQLADAEAGVAILFDGLWTRVAQALAPPLVRQVVVADVADDLPLLARWGLRVRRLRPLAPTLRAGERTAPRLAALGRGGGAIEPWAAASADEPAILLYTGGTTGRPKAAVLSHRNLVANASQLGAWASGLDDGAEVMLSALPLVHGYAMTACMNVSILRGWTQVLVPDPRDTGRLLDAIERWKVTMFPGVPTLYGSLCDHPDVVSGHRDLHSIEACISGAATLPSGVQAEFERLTGGRLVEGYGLSEASPATHCNPLEGGGRPGSIGLPLPDTDCRLVDLETETTEVAGPGPGVLCVSGPQVMSGYWRRPDETAAALRTDADGRTWLHTGDVAEMSADGYFRIVDRKKDIIVAAGGLKVYPNEIEDALSTHPKVRQAAVIGIPVGGADQRAKAFVVLRDGEHADADEVVAFLRDRLAPYKLPKAVEFRDELPLAFTGKVLRRMLAQEEQAREA